MLTGYLVNDAVVYKQSVSHCGKVLQPLRGQSGPCKQATYSDYLQGALNHKRSLPVCRIHSLLLLLFLSRYLIEQLLVLSGSVPMKCSTIIMWRLEILFLP